MNKPYLHQLAQDIEALIASVEPHIPHGIKKEVEDQEREWAQVCDLLGLDPKDEYLKRCALVFMQYLLELLTSAEAGGQPEQAVALRGAAVTLAIGVFGQEYLAAQEEEKK